MRITGLEERDAAWWVRPLYWIVRKALGRVPGPVKVQARTPGIAWTINIAGAAVESSGLVDRRLHSLMHLRGAQRIGCLF